MARGCSESDSEEERHDRFRSERNNISTNSTKSLFSTGLDQSNKSRSPLRRLNSPTRRERRSPIKRSRSRSNRRSKERRKSKDRRESKEKSKKDDKISTSRSSSTSKESRRSDGKDSRYETRRRSDSKSRRRSSSKEKRRRRENKRNHLDTAQTDDDTFLQRFERRRPSVENEVVENTVTYRDSSPEINDRIITKTVYESSRSQKKEKKRKKSHCETEEGELISEEENNCFGPALPPPRLESEQEEGEIKENSLKAEGPALPPGFNQKELDTVFGPQMPDRQCKNIKNQENIEKNTNLDSSKKSNSEDDSKNEKRLIGPMLPPTKDRLPTGEDDDKDVAQYGPALPPQSSASSASTSPSMDIDDVDLASIIGPLPKGMDLDDNVQRILEERAQYLRKQLENKDTDEFGDEKTGRESWMLELPEAKTSAQLGLGPRKFKIREGPDMSDRSSWTDIAGSKKSSRKETSDKKMSESRRLEITARNEEMENLCKETPRDEVSLLKLHQKELKKKRKKEHEMSGGKVERRPFSREIDLQTNRFDEAQRKTIINKAQLLNSRFASGESKYL